MAIASFTGRVSLLLVALWLAGCAGLRPAAPREIPIHHASDARGTLRAGAAAVDITPDGSIFMGGYDFARRSRGVHDPLSARAIVLERGDLRLGLVAVDVVGLQRQDVLSLGDALRAAGFDPRHVVIHATHNHGGPDTVGIWGIPPVLSGKSDDVMKQVEQGIIAALEAARDALRPAELAAGALRIDPEGVMKNLRQPGLLDRELGVVHLREPENHETIATLFALGVHPEVLTAHNQQLTADFPGVARERVEHALGGTAVFVSGALGAMITPDVQGADRSVEGGDFPEMERMGERVGAYALEAVARLAVYGQPDLAVWHAPMLLRNRNWRYQLMRMTRILDRTLYRGGWFETEVNLWKLGRVEIVTVPGEITPDLGLRVKRAIGGEPTLLVGLANDELGYLLPSEEFNLPIYSYERTLSPSSQAGDRVVRRIEDVLLLRRNGGHRGTP